MSAPSRDKPRDLLGRLLRDLRISVTDRCNLRCPYCMPAEVFGERYKFLPRDQILSFEEIERITRTFVELGVTKLRVTGGEPLLRAQLPRLIELLASIPGVEDLALTTNGLLLASQAQALRDAGLRRVTVSLDSIDENVFEKMNGRERSVATVLEGIAQAERVGLAPLKINCVVQRGVNDQTIVELARHFRGSGHVVRFIEFMDVGTLNRWQLEKVVSAAEILRCIGAELPIESVKPHYPGEVARRYRYTDGSGEIGIIASVSQPFCRDCTRARITPEGRLVTCLFANTGLDLKTLLRGGASDAALRRCILETWSGRRDRYSEERSENSETAGRFEMYHLGG